MELACMILLLFLIILLFVSNLSNKVNKWCAFSGLLFWLGILKETYILRVIPFLGKELGGMSLFTIPYSLMAWAANTLAMPAAVLTSLYFFGMDSKNPKQMWLIRILLCVPILLLLFLFPPLTLYEQEMGNPLFWPVYSSYNLVLGIIFTVIMIKSILIEKPGKIKTQKLIVNLISLPLVVYSLLAVYVMVPLGLRDLFDLWQGFSFIIVLCLALYIYMAFRYGVMGLRLSRETYNWTSDMELINKSAEYVSHILKNQTDKIAWCIENLKSDCISSHTEIPEELGIMSRSLSSIKNNIEKIREHSEAVSLHEETINLKTLIEGSIVLPTVDVDVHLSLYKKIMIRCDKTHMGEVFSNIIVNAYEAIKSTKNTGTIRISGEYDSKKSFYLIRITDDGVGMGKKEIGNIFKPHFSTKSLEMNFGLGLSYCKNVIDKHGGHIEADSRQGEGTTIMIALPANRIGGE